MVQTRNNLLDNAVNFTDKGGIVVRVRMDETINETMTIVLEVEDTGIGIPEGEVDKVFSSCEQTESTIDQLKESMGQLSAELLDAMRNAVQSGDMFKFNELTN